MQHDRVHLHLRSRGVSLRATTARARTRKPPQEDTVDEPPDEDGGSQRHTNQQLAADAKVRVNEYVCKID
jgi:hypothetical protein